MIKSHHLDERSQDQKQEDLISLNIIQDILERQISAYALENAENLFDVERQEIVRKLEFSRGLRQHMIVLAPDGFIRAISKRFPSTLLQEIHNTFVGLGILGSNDLKEF